MTTLGPKLARTPLHLFWLLDTSGSMSVDGKIEALNDAVRAAASALIDAVDENPGVELLVCAVTFDHDARWHIAEPTPIEHLTWSDLTVTPRGTTEMGRAIDLVVAEIVELAQGGRGLPPAMILVSDGKPTDLKAPSFGAALRALHDVPWALKASRMAIGIGQDAHLETLRRFIGHDEIAPLLAGNAAELAHYLRWASTVVVEDLSRTGGSFDVSSETSGVTLTEPPSLDQLPPPEGKPVDAEAPDLETETEGHATAEVDLSALPPPSGRGVTTTAPPPLPDSEVDDVTTW